MQVVDLLAPYAKGGKIGLFGGAGVGKTAGAPGMPQDAWFSIIFHGFPWLFHDFSCVFDGFGPIFAAISVLRTCSDVSETVSPGGDHGAHPQHRPEARRLQRFCGRRPLLAARKTVI